MGELNSEANRVTFRTLDGNGKLPSENSALKDWYISVRDVPVPDMSIFDLARACRQNLFLEAVVPISIQTLGQDVLAGELYDGELVSALMHIPDDYWNMNYDQWSRFVPLAEAAFKEVGEENL